MVCALGKKINSRFLLAFFALIIMTLTFSADCFARNVVEYVPDEFIIEVDPSATRADVNNAASWVGAYVVKELKLRNHYLIKLGNHPGSSSSFQGSPNVRWVIKKIQPNHIARFTAVPNDEFYDRLWGLRMINMEQAWEIQKGSSSIVVCVLDSGVLQHSDLINRLGPGWNAVDGNANYFDTTESHGTHVAGTIAAETDNGIGVAGVCWEGVRLMPVKIGDEGIAEADMISGLDYAIQNGAHVVNMSFGGYGAMNAFYQKIKEAFNRGMVLVAATGNDAYDVMYPARFPEVIAVGSVGPEEQIAYYSNYGPGNEVTLVAPGGDANYGANGLILSTVGLFDEENAFTGYGYQGYQGTSMACPHVSGAAALLLSNGVSPSRVRERLISSARAPSSGFFDRRKYGAGILNVQAALAAASVSIQRPAKGSVTQNFPDFRISFYGVGLSTIKVYLNYVDTNNNGIPDNIALETPVIDSSNIFDFVNSSQTAIDFNWRDISNTPLPSGKNFIYVVASADVGGTEVSDWAAFDVADQRYYAGIHLFAFPYNINTSQIKPTDILVPFNTAEAAGRRPMIVRWLNVPTSTTDSTPIGYASWYANSLNPYSALAWENPITSQGWVAGGGFVDNPLGGASQYVGPAGSGYWVVLPYDAVINPDYATLSSPNGFDIRLYNGWNMIGNPFGQTVPWRAAMFSYRGSEWVDINTAVRNGWIKTPLFGYSSSSGGYFALTERDMLQPFSGYWLRAKVGSVSANDALIMKVLP
ncbi:MAG: S8 family serine peptidase [Armatimonadota bacterium]